MEMTCNRRRRRNRSRGFRRGREVRGQSGRRCGLRPRRMQKPRAEPPLALPSLVFFSNSSYQFFFCFCFCFPLPPLLLHVRLKPYTVTPIAIASLFILSSLISSVGFLACLNVFFFFLFFYFRMNKKEKGNPYIF